MKGMLPIPEGISLPKDAASKPFTMSGKFLLHGDHLMALELDGYPVAGPEMEYEEEYGKEEGEDEGEGECCGEYKKGKMCPDCPKQSGGFLVAIERAMKPRKGG